jgi:hypothetical protein
MKPAPISFWKRLKEIDRFFQGASPVHQTMNRVAKELEKASIPYAVMGGMAVNAHGHHQTTDDLDLLMTAEGLGEFHRRFVGLQFKTVPDRPRRFLDRLNGVTLDVYVTGRYPRNGKPEPIAFPDPAEVRERIKNIEVLDLATLLQLKLAARRYRDFADVIFLIRVQHLDESFAERLPKCLWGDYLVCLEAMRREDEWEARVFGDGSELPA